MTEETEGTAAAAGNGNEDGGPTNGGPTIERYAAFPKFRPGILETGEGSLLEQTRSLVDVSLKPTVSSVDLEGGEKALLNLGHGEDGTTLEVIDPRELDAYRKKPLYRSGTAEIGDLDSLIAYADRFKDESSVLFADDDRKAPSITAVLDYHHAGGAADGGQQFGRHQARHALPLSDEWQAWAEYDGETISMPNFARFLEDHIVDVLPPGMIELPDEQDRFVTALGGKQRIADPAKLMELATGLRVYEDSEVSQATNLQSGEGQLVLTSKHTDGQGGQLIIPSMFVIAIPVFRHGERYQIIVRLRYRKTSGGIVFVYELWRGDLVFDHAFNEAVQRAAEETSLIAFRGKRGDS